MIRALAKSHAFALVGEAQGAGAIFTALSEQPSLAAFVGVRTAHVNITPQLASFIHPTVVLANAADGKTVLDVSHKLCKLLPRGTLVEGSSREDPDFGPRVLMPKLLAMFVENKWSGHVAGQGHNPKLPLLTRLAGGVRSYNDATFELPDTTPAAKASPMSKGSPAVAAKGASPAAGKRVSPGKKKKTKS